MAFQKLSIPAGVFSVYSQTLAMGRWWNSQLVRFFEGCLQKFGGWTHVTAQTVIGVCRAMHYWADLLGNPYVGLGTNQRLLVLIGGVIYDITPIRATTNPAVAFTTLIGQQNVTITDAGNGASAGDWINIVVPVSVGGLVLLGFYQVISTIDADNYVVAAATPATASVTAGGAVPEFTTTNLSTTVKVTLNNHGLTLGVQFPVQVSTTVGGVILSGSYAVSSVIDANNFDIVGTAATSSTSGFENGGNAQIAYLLGSGFGVNTPATGYGIGPYGAGLYGMGNGGSSAVNLLRQWYLDNWGEDLIGNPTNGGIYVWAPPDPTVPAAVVATAPTKSWASFVIAQVQVLVCLGAESGGTQYPNLVRWSDVGDYTDFTPTAANEAGSFQIPSGSSIVAGLAVGLGALIWTDRDLWAMTYQGLPFVFAFNRIGANCEAISPKAPAVIGNGVLWPSSRNFFRYDANGVNPIVCPNWDFFYLNYDQTQTQQIFSAVNTYYNEVTWFFPIAPSSPLYSATPTSTTGPWGYLKFSYLENGGQGAWDYGFLSRTAWIDHSILGGPLSVDTANLIQQQDTGADADGTPLVWFAESGFFDIGNGEDFVFVDMWIPDAQAVGSYQITVKAVDFPGATPRVYGPVTVEPGNRYFTQRVRGRQAAIMFSGNTLGSTFRLGALRYRVSPSGRR